MVTTQKALVKELQELAAGLDKGNILVLRRRASMYECQFLDGGLVCHVVQLHNTPLAAALLQVSVTGIIAGATYETFKNTFSEFCFKIKTRSLYQELKATAAESIVQPETLAVA